MRLDATNIKDLNLLKYYRLIRKWACKTYGLKDADLELLIYLDCKDRFTRNDFIDGTYTYSWDKNRWERLRKQGWIDVWRHRNRTTIKYSIYKTSFKCKQLIMRIYRIMLAVAFGLGLPAIYLKLFSAVIVVIAISIPLIKPTIARWRKIHAGN